MVHGHEESDFAIVAAKPANKAERSAAELPCFTCGQTKKMGPRARMCKECQSLSPMERRILRAKRKPKGSVWAVSGGLPSLGKRR
jgi:hypothetical protein